MADWITQYIKRVIAKAANGHGDCCITLESRRSADSWVQITWEHVNFAYPSSDDPKNVLNNLPNTPHVKLVAAEPGSYFTVAHNASESMPALGDLIAAYMQNILRVMPDEDLWDIAETTL